MMKYMIGIDAGGTHSTAIAYDENGKELGRAESGPGQINNDYELGLKNIAAAVNELRDKIDGDCMKVLAGIAGLSVVGNAPEVAATISSMVGNIPTRAITDSLLALYNGLEGADGALVIAGTGSVVNGRQDGSLITVGGYGSLLGDEGSGYAITKAALQAALLKWDRREESSLVDLFVKIWNLDSMNDAAAKFYTMTSPEVASNAVEIAKLADSGNEEARNIIQQQAHFLARDIIMCLDRYEDPKPMRVALTGSVLSNNAMMRSFMEDEVKEKYPDVIFSVSNGENARGVIFDKSKDYRYFTNHEDDK
ncbi:BadF/BadG/BcrA/BcrD ATPase family protein [Lactobacillus sp.]|uniref:N-acetylglucosamine kinase n=1 Tax=Lactobacillus sp. TaxID=1591 RepID=UPI0025C39CE2|nr:BadF/BadG/BcrA/BcrD ATPase family protein [Lactobacillus sp.]